MTTERVNVLGVGVSVTNRNHALETIEEWITNGTSNYICVTGMHGVMESQKDEDLCRIHNRSGLTVPDGRPLFWLGRLAGHSVMQQVPGQEFIIDVCEASVAKGWRHFFYGGNEGVAEELAANLQERFPGLQVAGTYCPPFRPLTDEEEADLAAQVTKGKTDILWVGLSTPKQERFMASHIDQLDATVMLGVGAAFDLHTGRIPATPPALRYMGLEWAYRVYCEPKRLWKRYAVNNPRFLGLLALQKLALKRFPIRR